MGNLNEFFRDLGRNAYGLGENVASLGSAAIAEPVAGFAAMYDPANGAQAIREGMTYTPRTEAGQMYQQGAANTLGAMVKPAMPVIESWQRGVDIAGRYSPATGAALQTVPTALGALMGYKPAMQTGRQLSNSLGAMQARMIANANAPRTLNTGYMGQRGAVGTQRPLTELEQAHLTAQRNAALPVNQGGLGLPADNTAMDRARAMGFDTDNIMYHGTNNSFESFNPARGGIYFTDDKKLAGQYGKKKIEALLNYGASVEKDAMGGGFNDIENYQFLNDKTRRMRGDSSVVMKNFSDSPNPSVYSKPSTVAAINNPSQIRSPNAAFDPFNRYSSNLLAQSARFAPAATLGALMANEKRKYKRNQPTLIVEMTT